MDCVLVILQSVNGAKGETSLIHVDISKYNFNYVQNNMSILKIGNSYCFHAAKAAYMRGFITVYV